MRLIPLFDFNFSISLASRRLAIKTTEWRSDERCERARRLRRQIPVCGLSLSLRRRPRDFVDCSRDVCALYWTVSSISALSAARAIHLQQETRQQDEDEASCSRRAHTSTDETEEANGQAESDGTGVTGRGRRY